MMQQLLRITTTPMKYELEVEHSKLEYKQTNPSASLETKQAKLSITSKTDTSVNIDTYEARKSLGIMDSMDFARTNAEQSRQAITKKIGEYREIGNAISNIQDGVSIADIYRSKMTDSSYQLYTAFLPSGGAELTWNPAQLNMSFEPSDVSIDWNIEENSFNFIPGSVRMKITQMSSVNIEYIGGPLYFPPSAREKITGEAAEE